jgi:hypothetical protein
VLVTEFLEEDESHLLLQACDIVVFSYQYTAESSSAAVRHGLSSLRPVLTTPLPIFDNVRELVYQSKGVSAVEIADAVETLLSDTDLQNRLKAKQAEWLSQHDWSTISERFANMVIGLHEDGHDVTVVRDVPVPRGGERKSTSAEERSWAEQISDEAFVRIAFQRAMGRDASPEDVARHVQLLRDESRKRAELLSALESSEEGRARATAGREAKGFDNVHVPTIPFDELDVGENTLFVDNLYRRLLNRAPDRGGFEQYLGFLRAGGNRRKVVESMLTSEEFRHKDRPIRILWGDDAQV